MTIQVHDRRLGPLWFPAGDQVVAAGIARSGGWEPLEGLWLDQSLRPGMTMVNVGANVGYFALWAAQLVGPSGRVVAVEPHPVNCELLRRNVADRGLQDVVEVVEAAASHQTGRTNLYLNDRNNGDHRVYAPGATATEALSAAAAGFAAEPRTVVVDTVRLDDLLAGRHVDVLLTDAQGWDHQVLRGASALLRRDRPVVLSEFFPELIESVGEDPLAVLAETTEPGYDVGAWDAGAAPGDWPLAQLEAWARRRWFTNLELWPRERPLPPRVRPADGFWQVERTGAADRWWLTEDSGVVRLAGPAHWRGELRLTLRPPPGFDASGRLADQPFRLAGPRELRLRVRLNGRGRAELPLTVSSPGRKMGSDPRTLFVAVLNPVVR